MALSRLTQQKQILDTVTRKQNAFFSADALHEEVKSEGISLATVYRYLKSAVTSGELHSYLCDRKQIYSVGQKSHCHFKCEKTGKVIHFTLDSLDFLSKKVPGTITSVQLEVTGICDDCSN
jgi:Fe2+ or Zn2+ uptake regulation protein